MICCVLCSFEALVRADEFDQNNEPDKAVELRDRVAGAKACRLLCRNQSHKTKWSDMVAAEKEMRERLEYDIPFLTQAFLTKRWALDQKAAGKQTKWASVFKLNPTERDKDEETGEDSFFWDMDCPSFGDCAPPESATDEEVSQWLCCYYTTFFNTELCTLASSIKEAAKRERLIFLLEEVIRVVNAHDVDEWQEVVRKPVLFSALGVLGVLVPELGFMGSRPEHVWYLEFRAPAPSKHQNKTSSFFAK